MLALLADLARPNAFGTDAPTLAATIVLLVSVFLLLIRAIKGPTAYDRILAMNVIGTKAVLIVCLIGFVTQRPDFIDIALVYGILNFLSTIAILKFVRHKRLG